MKADRKHTIYLLDDDVSVYSSMALLLSNIDAKLHFFTILDNLIHAINNAPPDCLLVELNLKPDNGLVIFEALKSLNIDPPTIFLSTHNSTSTAVEAMKAGALDFIEKPFTETRLINAIIGVIDSHQ